MQGDDLRLRSPAALLGNLAPLFHKNNTECHGTFLLRDVRINCISNSLTSMAACQVSGLGKKYIFLSF